MIHNDTDVAPPPSPSANAAEIERLAEQIEAILITSSRPVSMNRLGQALGLIEVEETPSTAATSDQPESVVVPKPRRRKPKGDVNPQELITQAVATLNDIYEKTGRAFRVEQVAGGFRLMTIARHRAVIAQFHGLTASTRLSKAAIETMAIIAYKQPLTRAKLEAIRGVACGEVLRSLLERRLITITGRAEELGRPMLYGTTRQFLEAFGLASLKDLPSPQELGTLKRV